ncbi:hypothetical protein [Kitasatospora acidiphila]|uniref:hypothetical protein n=1 Tax=Kitasatospora acidiphila TaxID=2567942 RepID=UPI003C78DCD9
MSDDYPTDERGLRRCARCGEKVQQPATGRLRDYCGRTCRELAYRERRTGRLIAEAVTAALTPPVSSVDETVDVTPPAPVPAPGRPSRWIRQAHIPTRTDTLPLWEE